MMERANQAEGDVDRIVHQRFFKGREGIFVEVGAARPDYLSVSALFRQQGWQIIAVEPNPAYQELHRERGYEVLQYACGDHDADDVEFCVVDSHGTEYANGEVSFESFSSLAIKANYASLKCDLDITKIRVRLRRLDTILRDHAPEVEAIDIVCVDVEGWELEVLNGLTFDRYQPKLLIIENMFFERRYHAFMRERGYSLWKTIDFNEIYARRDILTPLERGAGSVASELKRVKRALRKRLARTHRVAERPGQSDTAGALPDSGE
jgi:FkbM family methyltransferase